MKFEDIKIGQRVSATYSDYTNRLGTIVDVRGGRAEIKFDDGFTVYFSHEAARFLSLVEPRVFKTGQRVSFPDPLTRETVNGCVIDIAIDGSAITVQSDGWRKRVRAAFDVSDERVQPIEMADDLKSEPIAPLGSTRPTLDDLWLGQRVRVEKEGDKNHGKEGVVVSSSPIIVRFDDGSHDALGVLNLVVIKAPIEKQLREKAKTFTYAPTSETEWKRPSSDNDRPISAGSLFYKCWDADGNERSGYTLPPSMADFIEALRKANEVHANRRSLLPFIWLLVDGAETAHIVDGVSGVYFMATAARISDDSFKWTLHENKRLVRIGFSSDLKTAKEDAEKFCRERMAVHRRGAK